MALSFTTQAEKKPREGIHRYHVTTTRDNKTLNGTTFFLKNCFFLKIWPSKSGYRQLRRPKSLPRMRFSSLYDASPPRNITVCVFDLDLGRKKTSLRKGAPDLSKKKQKCKLISYQYYKIFVLKSQQKPSGKIILWIKIFRGPGGGGSAEFI